MAASPQRLATAVVLWGMLALLLVVVLLRPATAHRCHHPPPWCRPTRWWCPRRRRRYAAVQSMPPDGGGAGGGGRGAVAASWHVHAFHGFACSWGSWLPLMTEARPSCVWTAHDWRTPDPRGADDVADRLRRAAPRPLVYVGHSLGAMAALRAADRHPPAAIVLLAPALLTRERLQAPHHGAGVLGPWCVAAVRAVRSIPPAWLSRMLALAGCHTAAPFACLRWWEEGCGGGVGAEVPPRSRPVAWLQDLITGLLHPEDPAGWGHGLPATDDALRATIACLAARGVRFLVVHGDRDVVVPWELGRRWWDRVDGAVSVVRLEGAGHLLPTAHAPVVWQTMRERLR